MPSLVHRGDLGGRRRHGDHLPRGAGLGAARAVRRGRGRRRRHPGARSGTSRCRTCAAIMLITLILQIIGTAQVFLEPYLFTDGGPDNATLTVLLLVYDYAFGNSLGGDYGKATALSLMLAGGPRLFSLPSTSASPGGGARVSPAWTPRRRALEPAAAARPRPPPARRRAPPRTRRARDHHAARARAARSPGGRAGSERRAARRPGRSSRSARCCGWRSRRSRRPRTRCAHPMALWPNGTDWENLRTAWVDIDLKLYFWNTVVIAAGSWAMPDGRRDDRRLRAVDAAPAVRRVLYGLVLATHVRPGRRPAGAALPDGARRAVRALEPGQHLVGRVPAGRRERVQRRAGQAVLRQPAARGHRGRPRGRLR